MSVAHHHAALRAGTVVEEFKIHSILGHGGFGITYLAEDLDLKIQVAIKEFMPNELAVRLEGSTVAPKSDGDQDDFEWGRKRFVEEAQILARFRHPNIVRVARIIREANGTAYFVMDYYQGEPLNVVLDRQGTLPNDELQAMLVPLLDGLAVLHQADVVHRDIKPGNIYIRSDGPPVLLDFGAAREGLSRHSRSVSAMATAGYAAFEQYQSRGKQGPWTDIYGLGATLYRCVTGNRPPDATDRITDDDMVSAKQAAAGSYAPELLSAIDAALEVRIQDRPQSVAAWREMTEVQEPEPAVPNEAPASDTDNTLRVSQRLETAGTAHIGETNTPDEPKSPERGAELYKVQKFKSPKVQSSSHWPNSHRCPLDWWTLAWWPLGWWPLGWWPMTWSPLALWPVAWSPLAQ